MIHELNRDELELEVYTRIKRAEQIFNGQFFTKAAKKEAMDNLNSAYSNLRRIAVDNFFGGDYEFIEDDLDSSTPSFELHHVREAKHKGFFEKHGEWEPVAELVELRSFYKSQEVVAKPKAVKSEGHRTERSAKHWGHCQLCGRKHKLDVRNNKVADHGYIVDGWRSGGCNGSFCLPIELSCEEVKNEIVRLERRLEKYQEMERKGEKVPEGQVTFGPRRGETIYGEPSKYIRWCENDMERLEEKVANWKPVSIEDLEEVLYDDNIEARSA